MTRIAIVDKTKCRPTKCKRECISICPPQRGGREVIRIVDIEDTGIKKQPEHLTAASTTSQIAEIVESQCIGCNMCVKACPFDAIRIVNLPHEKPEDLVYSYGKNSFRLYRLPSLSKGKVTGLIGQNGIGKTTIINILAGKLKIDVSKFNGTAMGKYFADLTNGKLKGCNSSVAVVCKPQMLRARDMKVSEFIEKYGGSALNNKSGPQAWVRLKHSTLYDDIMGMLDKNLNFLSGGELQLLYIYTTLTIDAGLYIFDEPSNYLDVSQRLRVTQAISAVKGYCLVIDHDLAMVDYLANEIYVVYGEPGAFGICSQRYSVSEGINNYMNGYLPVENVRIRDDAFKLESSLQKLEIPPSVEKSNLEYPATTINYDNFCLHIDQAMINIHSAIYVILGQNGTGKSTFMNYLRKSLNVIVSWKPQDLIYNNSDDTVEDVLLNMPHDGAFQRIIKPLVHSLNKRRKVSQLSGGELQKLSVAICLSRVADVYLIDEPSANVDIETRLVMINVIKRFVLHYKKAAFVIEHDIMMAVSLSQEWLSKVYLVSNTSDSQTGNRSYIIHPPMDFTTGINQFLSELDITMRFTDRPRINKYGSVADREQKASGNLYGGN